MLHFERVKYPNTKSTKKTYYKSEIHFDIDENLGLLPQKLSQMQETEMRILRLIRGVTKSESLKNEEILRSLIVESIFHSFTGGKGTTWMVWTCQENGKHRIPKKMFRLVLWGQTAEREIEEKVVGMGKALEKWGESLVEVEENEAYADREGWRRLIRGDIWQGCYPYSGRCWEREDM